MNIPKDELRARAYLLHVMDGPTPEFSAFLALHGPVDTVVAIRSGSAPEAVLAAVVRPDVPLDEVAVEHDGARLIVPGCDEWPTWPFRVLRERGLEPIGLWVRGVMPLALLAEHAAAVVGTETPSSYGTRIARRFAHGLAIRGVAVIGRGIAGVDAAAHRAALHANGLTVAVVASGVDVAHAPNDADLLDEIVTNAGLVVSEAPPGTMPNVDRARAAHRIVAALGRVIVVEAETADEALEIGQTADAFGRLVYAVPGDIEREGASGPNELLRLDQATVVTHVSQVEMVEFGG